MKTLRRTKTTDSPSNLYKSADGHDRRSRCFARPAQKRTSAARLD